MVKAWTCHMVLGVKCLHQHTNDDNANIMLSRYIYVTLMVALQEKSWDDQIH